jgi:mono/diheme cytochrome c family protein
MRHVIFTLAPGTVCLIAAFGNLRADDNTGRHAVYTAEQASGGGRIYDARCGGCHGYEMSGGGMGPALKGNEFWGSWGGKTARSLYSRIITSMPAGDPGSLSVKDTLDLMAYLLSANDYPAGDTKLEKASQLDNVKLQRAN